MKTEKLISYLLIALISLASSHLLMAQDTKKSNEKIEKTQKQIENIYMKIYEIIEQYPQTSYKYLYTDGNITGVEVKAINNKKTKRKFMTHLMDLQLLKKQIFGTIDHTGVYYVAEKEPKPEIGYEEYLNQLHNNIQYPLAAREQGVEGTIFAKFVVDDTGEIDNVVLTDKIDTPSEYILNKMKDAAKEALTTTYTDWEPATLGGTPVSHWVVVPIQFKLNAQFLNHLFWNTTSSMVK